MRDFFLDCLAFVDGTDRRFWNVSKQPATFAAQHPRRARRLVLTYGYVNMSLRKLFLFPCSDVRPALQDWLKFSLQLYFSQKVLKTKVVVRIGDGNLLLGWWNGLKVGCIADVLLECSQWFYCHVVYKTWSYRHFNLEDGGCMFLL
jgi:hypothetical protein